MALHPDSPHSPHAILDPEIRWFPADEILRDTTMDKLMPPLVAQLRRKVKDYLLNVKRKSELQKVKKEITKSKKRLKELEFLKAELS